MNSSSPSPESIAQMSVLTLTNFKLLNDFSQTHRITISGIYVYIAIGALNIHKLDDTRIMFISVTPSNAAKQLKFTAKKMGRWFITLADRGLLLREESGAYRVADLAKWVDVAKLLNVDIPDFEFSTASQAPLTEFQATNGDFGVARTLRASMRDRL